jgi:kynureninase
MTLEPFNRRRDEFPTLASGIHLLSHSLGPMPRAGRDSMIAYCDAWERHTSEDAWATSWWELSQLVGDQIARILGGSPGSVQIQPNTSIALSSVVSCFDFGKSKRNKVVTTSLTTMEYIWDGQNKSELALKWLPRQMGSQRQRKTFFAPSMKKMAL